MPIANKIPFKWVEVYRRKLRVIPHGRHWKIINRLVLISRLSYKWGCLVGKDPILPHERKWIETRWLWVPWTLLWREKPAFMDFQGTLPGSTRLVEKCQQGQQLILPLAKLPLMWCSECKISQWKAPIEGNCHPCGVALKRRGHDWLKLCFCSTDHSYYWNGRTRWRMGHAYFWG
jgi:hypothetical protein